MATQDGDGKALRGFARMEFNQRRRMAALGGAAVKRENRSFSVNRELAAEAGRRGGSNVPSTERSFSKDRALAQAAGRQGGLNAQAKKRRPLSG